jgi:uncharacterized protein YxjI
MSANPYTYPHYVIRRDLFNFLNRKFHIYDPDGQLAFYCEMKAFKLREDIRIYADEAKSRELLVLKARQILDISPTFDVWDSAAKVKVGALKRQGLKSMIQDEWAILDANDRQFGKVQEDSLAMAMIRRFLSNLIPQSYTVEIQGQEIITFKQNFNPFVLKLNLDFSRDPQGRLDRRLGIAAAMLLAAIEGRQSSY